MANAPEAVKDTVYFGTRGLGHFGLLKALHDDLAEIGLPARVLNEFKNNAAENFIRTWEKSEYIGKNFTVRRSSSLSDPESLTVEVPKAGLP